MSPFDRQLLKSHAADLRRLAEAYDLNTAVSGKEAAATMAKRVNRIADLIDPPAVAPAQARAA